MKYPLAATGRTVLFLLAVTGFLCPASSQYFGQNKVQYETFDFQILHTDRFAVYYYPVEEDAARRAGQMLERWYDRFRAVFGRPLRKRQPVILYASHADFQQTNVITGLIPQGVGGVTEGLKNRIVIPLSGDNREDDHVLGHELVHAFQFEIIRGSPRGLTDGEALPLWFVEGQAEYLSMGSQSVLTATWMRDAVLRNKLPTIAQIGRNPSYFPYRYGHAIWAYIAGTYGDSIAGPLFRSVILRGMQRGFKATLGIGIDSLSKNWQAAMRETYGRQVQGRSQPQRTGSMVVHGETNLSPALSPDGKLIAFLSTRGVFTLDLFLADAQTGKVLGKLASQETDRHYDALRFINSGGSWSPNGEQIAFPVYRKGRGRIALLDVRTRKILKLIGIKGARDIFQVAWSPDGGRLAVSGGMGGRNDLLLYSLSTGETEQVTHDAYSELQPAWSPDGRTLAFVSDRGADGLDSLVFGVPRIFLLDLETRELRPVMMREGVRHINPAFSPDGERLYFIADPDGFSDVYACWLASGTFGRVTRVATGVMGLTEISPALSVAAKTGGLAFNIFDQRKHSIHYLVPGVLDPVEPVDLAGDSAAYLPPRGRTRPVDAQTQGISVAGASKFRSVPYRPSLGLLYLGQLFAGLSVGRFGSGFTGGVNMLFSDFLGDHMVGVAAQIQGQVRDAGTEMVYWNRRHRTNWGLGLSHIPYPTSQFVAVVESTDTGTRTDILFLQQRIYIDRATGGVSYPLSQRRRLELTGGLTRIDYDNEADVLQVNGKSVLSRRSRAVESPPALTLVQTAAAYVGDDSYFGFTGPVRGSRYRLEAEPTAGSLFYVAALADYRRYFFLRPTTLAFRGLHIGRYLRDFDDDELTPLTLGDDLLVRGYRLGSFGTSECQGDPDSCPTFARLNGSRLIVANAEVRLPVIGTEQFGLVGWGFLPVDLFAFFDAGMAWTKRFPDLRWTTSLDRRVPVFSAGIGSRINLLGLLILQIYYGYPFQRPDGGGQWGFLIAPGW